MRKEFEQYYASTTPLHAQLRKAAASLSSNYTLLVETMLYQKLDAGSPMWHRTQSRLSGLSSAPHHMRLREAFYRSTLPNNPEGLRIYPDVYIHYPWRVRIGRRTVLNRGTLITAPAEVEIGENVLVGPYCVLNSGDHRHSDRTMPVRGQGHVLGPITIGPGSWLGAHVVVLQGVTVGEGAVIGAGAVVTRSVPPYSIAAGVPARVIGERGSS